MSRSVGDGDWLTAAAIGLIAMCIVTSDHEAFGHGGACLLLHGHILVLTSSIFHCDVRSGWIDPAGPFGNLLAGTLALAFLRFVPARLPGLRLFLILLTAFSFFWEGSYAAYAMFRRDGDLYFFAQFLIGDVALWLRWAIALCGIALYVFTARLTSRALLVLWPDVRIARRMARTAWLSATTGSALAALAYRGQGWGDLKDAVLELGVASIALLFLPRDPAGANPKAGAALARNPVAIAAAVFIFAAFAATLGRGVGAAFAS